MALAVPRVSPHVRFVRDCAASNPAPTECRTGPDAGCNSVRVSRTKEQMQATIEKVSSLERRLNVSLPMQEIDAEVENRLKRLARNVRMHGFRPGKVPFRLVQ